MKNYLDYTVDILEELLNISSPTGDTNKIIEVVKNKEKYLKYKETPYITAEDLSVL